MRGCGYVVSFVCCHAKDFQKFLEFCSCLFCRCKIGFAMSVYVSCELISNILLTCFDCLSITVTPLVVKQKAYVASFVLLTIKFCCYLKGPGVLWVGLDTIRIQNPISVVR